MKMVATGIQSVDGNLLSMFGKRTKKYLRITTGVVVGLVLAGLQRAEAYAKKTIGDAGSALNDAIAPTGLPKNEVATYVGNVARWFFGITGLIFFLLMLYAGTIWFLARGEEEKIAEAKKTIIAAIIGLLIAVSGFAISTFVTGAVGL